MFNYSLTAERTKRIAAISGMPCMLSFCVCRLYVCCINARQLFRLPDGGWIFAASVAVCANRKSLCVYGNNDDDQCATVSASIFVEI